MTSQPPRKFVGEHTRPARRGVLGCSPPALLASRDRRAPATAKTSVAATSPPMNHRLRVQVAGGSLCLDSFHLPINGPETPPLTRGAVSRRRGPP
jgi:hypothetical protein